VSFVPKVLERNWQLKVSALAMAVLLWTVPRFETQGSRVMEDVPVRIELSDPNWALVEDPSPATVSVTLSGPARELISLGVERPPVLVPMDEVLSGDTTVMLRTSWFRGSGRDGVVVEGLSPEAVRLSFEKIETRRVPFAAPFLEELPQGLSLAGPLEITPFEADTRGAASRLEGLDSIPLIPLDLAAVEGEGPFILQVDTTGLQGLQFFTMEVSVTVATEPTTAREFSDLPVRLPILNEDPQLQTRPASVTVVLLGARSLVEGVDPADISVTIPTSRSSLAPGQEVELVVVVEGIPDFVEARVTPVWVRLRRPVGR
jgi:YbbR domain-containing protein